MPVERAECQVLRAAPAPGSLLFGKKHAAFSDALGRGCHGRRVGRANLVVVMDLIVEDRAAQRAAPEFPAAADPEPTRADIPSPDAQPHPRPARAVAGSDARLRSGSRKSPPRSWCRSPRPSRVPSAGARCGRGACRSAVRAARAAFAREARVLRVVVLFLMR